MSNHVHILIDTSIQIQTEIEENILDELDIEPLHRIMKQIKGSTAFYANRKLNRKGPFWQRESFDRYIRSEKALFNTIHYILNNPVKAGLVKDWKDFPFTFIQKKENWERDDLLGG